MGTVTVRKSTTADVDVLADFQQRLAKESENFELDLKTVKMGIEAMFEDPSHGTYFIAEVDGVIAGCHSVTYEWSDWRNGMVWWLQSVYVSKDFRKNGVFKAMFQ